jgi:hypothetical protein
MGVGMYLRRLFLGLAAALAAVPGAGAADAVVVAEPEPMEYVRICDTYGVGFYYIPGTETCLKVSGYVRMDVGVGAFGLTDVVDKSDPGPFFDRNLNDTYHMRARFQLRLDSRAETELGTLRTYAAVNFEWETDTVGEDSYYGNKGFTETVADFSIEHAYLQLGGFRAGKTDSLFSTFTGYAGGVINDDVIGYGPYGTHQIAYGFETESGFAAAVALEVGDGDLIAPFIPPDFNQQNLYTLDSYVPHVVGGVAWQGAWGGVAAVAGYDSVWEEGTVKGRLDFYPTDRLSLFVMAGWSTYDSDYLDLDYCQFEPVFDCFTVETKDSPNYYAPWGGNWAVWAGGSFMLTDKATLNVQASYDEMEDFALVANVAYELVPNFVITPEIAYIDNFNDALDDWSEWNTGRDLMTENWGFFVRAQANFGG